MDFLSNLSRLGTLNEIKCIVNKTNINELFINCSVYKKYEFINYLLSLEDINIFINIHYDNECIFRNACSDLISI